MNQRNTRRIELRGNRRISAAIAIGKFLSDVAGFAIDMHYRGEIYSTDDHAASQTHEYELTPMFVKGTGDSLVVTIGIKIENLNPEVETYLKKQ